MLVNRNAHVALPTFQLVTIAASAGGLAALTTLLGRLPRGFNLPIAVVQHVDPNHVSLVAQILARKTALLVKQAAAADILQGGVVYVAPPGRHMLIGLGRSVRLVDTEPVRHLRPSADSLFISAAHTCGRVIGVVLSGTGTDGTQGAAAIKECGGTVIAQDEATSTFFGMPQSAIDAGVVDCVLPVEDIAARLIELAEILEP